MHETVASESIAGRVLAVLPRLHHTLKRDRMRRESATSSERTFSARMGQYRLLMLLWEQERLTTHQLTELMEVSAPTVSTMVRSLTEQGLVARSRDETDHRVFWLTITEAGRSLVESEQHCWCDVFLHRFEQLSPEDQRLISDAVPAFERLLEIDPCGRRG